MVLKRCPLVFHNVLSAKARCKLDEWDVLARELRNSIIKNGLYSTGPIMYQLTNLQDREADYTFYIPVNTSLQMSDNNKYDFTELLKIEDGLSIRHADLDEDLALSYELLRACANENQFVLQEPFYHIYLDVYGGGLIDIYAPIVKEV